ncbi:MAG TPA: SPFH domain-containing protein [Myxococcales bacterium]|jgi:regulator of protease activity HflC (stomatin/prohibitin superfamily)
MRKLLFVALLQAACTFHNTASTEVGVLTRKIALFGKAGVQQETYLPGATYTFPAFITDWNVYNVALQNLEMVQAADRGDRSGRDDIEFKTHDGNDITVDVTVAWRIDPAKTPYMLERVGGTTAEVKENLVRPACRSIVRDVLNTMTSEEFYVSDKRFQKAEEARANLAKVLGPEGVIVERVIMGEHHFHPDYEKVIHDKKLAEQTAERMVSEGHAAQQEALRNLETARGQVTQKIATAQGSLNQVKLAADADYFRSQRESEAILAEKRAHAKGVQKQNEAMSGAGGRTLVKLHVAEALAGKQIVFLPGGKGGSLQTTNLNDLLARFAATNVQPPAVEAQK